MNVNVDKGAWDPQSCYATSPCVSGNPEKGNPETTENTNSGMTSRVTELSLKTNPFSNTNLVGTTESNKDFRVKVIKATEYPIPNEVIYRIITLKYSDPSDRKFYLRQSEIWDRLYFKELINENVFLAVSDDKIVGFFEGRVWSKTAFYIRNTGELGAEDTSNLSSAEIKKGLMLSVMDRVKQLGFTTFTVNSLVQSSNKDYKEEWNFFVEDFKKHDMQVSHSCFNEHGYKSYTIRYDLETLPNLKTLKELNSFCIAPSAKAEQAEELAIYNSITSLSSNRPKNKRGRDFNDLDQVAESE